MTKGKYITTSLLLAALASGKYGRTVLVDETPANTTDHQLIWTKNNAQQPDELKKA